MAPEDKEQKTYKLSPDEEKDVVDRLKAGKILVNFDKAHQHLSDVRKGLDVRLAGKTTPDEKERLLKARLDIDMRMQKFDLLRRRLINLGARMFKEGPADFDDERELKEAIDEVKRDLSKSLDTVYKDVRKDLENDLSQVEVRDFEEDMRSESSIEIGIATENLRKVLPESPDKLLEYSNERLKDKLKEIYDTLTKYGKFWNVINNDKNQSSVVIEARLVIKEARLAMQHVKEELVRREMLKQLDAGKLDLSELRGLASNPDCAKFVEEIDVTEKTFTVSGLIDKAMKSNKFLIIVKEGKALTTVYTQAYFKAKEVITAFSVLSQEKIRLLLGYELPSWFQGKVTVSAEEKAIFDKYKDDYKKLTADNALSALMTIDSTLNMFSGRKKQLSDKYLLTVEPDPAVKSYYEANLLYYDAVKADVGREDDKAIESKYKQAKIKYLDFLKKAKGSVTVDELKITEAKENLKGIAKREVMKKIGILRIALSSLNEDSIKRGYENPLRDAKWEDGLKTFPILWAQYTDLKLILTMLDADNDVVTFDQALQEIDVNIPRESWSKDNAHLDTVRRKKYLRDHLKLNGIDPQNGDVALPFDSQDGLFLKGLHYYLQGLKGRDSWGRGSGKLKELDILRTDFENLDAVNKLTQQFEKHDWHAITQTLYMDLFKDLIKGYQKGELDPVQFSKACREGNRYAGFKAKAVDYVKLEVAKAEKAGKKIPQAAQDSLTEEHIQALIQQEYQQALYKKITQDAKAYKLAGYKKAWGMDKPGQQLAYPTLTEPQRMRADPRYKLFTEWIKFNDDYLQADKDWFEFWKFTKRGWEDFTWNATKEAGLILASGGAAGVVGGAVRSGLMRGGEELLGLSFRQILRQGGRAALRKALVAEGGSLLAEAETFNVFMNFAHGLSEGDLEGVNPLGGAHWKGFADSFIALGTLRCTGRLLQSTKAAKTFAGRYAMIPVVDTVALTGVQYGESLVSGDQMDIASAISNNLFLSFGLRFGHSIIGGAESTGRSKMDRIRRDLDLPKFKEVLTDGADTATREAKRELSELSDYTDTGRRSGIYIYKGMSRAEALRMARVSKAAGVSADTWGSRFRPADVMGRKTAIELFEKYTREHEGKDKPKLSDSDLMKLLMESPAGRTAVEMLMRSKRGCLDKVAKDIADYLASKADAVAEVVKGLEPGEAVKVVEMLKSHKSALEVLASRGIKGSLALEVARQVGEFEAKFKDALAVEKAAKKAGQAEGEKASEKFTKKLIDKLLNGGDASKAVAEILGKDSKVFPDKAGREFAMYVGVNADILAKVINSLNVENAVEVAKFIRVYRYSADVMMENNISGRNAVEVMNKVRELEARKFELTPQEFLDLLKSGLVGQSAIEITLARLKVQGLDQMLRDPAIGKEIFEILTLDKILRAFALDDASIERVRSSLGENPRETMERILADLSSDAPKTREAGKKRLIDILKRQGTVLSLLFIAGCGKGGPLSGIPVISDIVIIASWVALIGSSGYFLIDKSFQIFGHHESPLLSNIQALSRFSTTELRTIIPTARPPASPVPTPNFNSINVGLLGIMQHDLTTRVTDYTHHRSHEHTTDGNLIDTQVSGLKTQLGEVVNIRNRMMTDMTTVDTLTTTNARLTAANARLTAENARLRATPSPAAEARIIANESTIDKNTDTIAENTATIATTTVRITADDVALGTALGDLAMLCTQNALGHRGSNAWRQFWGNFDRSDLKPVTIILVSILGIYLFHGASGQEEADNELVERNNLIRDIELARKKAADKMKRLNETGGNTSSLSTIISELATLDTGIRAKTITVKNAKAQLADINKRIDDAGTGRVKFIGGGSGGPGSGPSAGPNPIKQAKIKAIRDAVTAGDKDPEAAAAEIEAIRKAP